jgi:flagellar biosynthesis anti-sigma factor FlgM
MRSVDERAAGVERPSEDVRASDKVQVSTTGQLAATAAAAANAVPDLRPDAVERGRALLERGELGRDAERLADALIDSLLDRS